MKSSIGKRLLVSLGSCLLILWLAVIASVTWVVQEESEEIFDSGLQETAQRLLTLAVHELELHSDFTWKTAEIVKHDEYLMYQVFNRRGDMLLRSHEAPSIAFPVPLSKGFYELADQYFYVEISNDGKYIIQLGERQGHRSDTLKRVLRYLLLPLLVLLPLAALAIYWSIQIVRRPILDFDKEISCRGGSNLQPLQLNNLPDELAGVGKSVDLLLERLRIALEAERNFAANSAHEMRTPLATAMAQLKVLEDELTDPKSKLRVSQAREVLDRLYQATAKLLQLARTNSGLALNAERVDFGMLIGVLLRGLSSQVRSQIIYQKPSEPVHVLGDIDALGIAVQNLLENACRHASANSLIEIEMTRSGELIIRNDCAPIPTEILSTLCFRFVRASQEKNGTGLGLSIVLSIARQSGGDLQLESPCYKNGRGFAAHLRLRLES